MTDLQKAVEKIMQRTKRPAKEEQEQTASGTANLIPTGSVMLNLACADSWSGGYGAGKIVNLIGDSSSGKTLLAFSMFAEMSRNERYKDYRLIYDDVEQACEFDIAKLFGAGTADRIVAPYYSDIPHHSNNVPQYSGTIQEFHANVMDAIKLGEPFVYVLDSFDALSSADEQDRAEKSIEATRAGKPVQGSYKMDKAKLSGEILRHILADLRSTGSLVLVISQTRDNIDPMSFTKKTRSGGNALRFYSAHEIWLAVKGKLKSKDRVIGSQIRAKVSKNKLTGKLREIEFPVYYSYGVDDIGAAVDFLVEEGKWGKKGNSLVTLGLPGFDGSRQKVIQRIEESLASPKLFALAGETWTEIEESLKMDRRMKYE